jgi:hypothetical protein
MVDSLLDALILLAGYAIATIGVGWLVDVVVPPPRPPVGERAGPSPPQLPLMAGLRVPVLIGWLERFLIVTFALLGEMTAVGIIVLAKTVLRYSETREGRAYAEYVLCGTLLSLSFGLALGLLIRRLLALA